MTNLTIKLEWKNPIFDESHLYEGSLPITIGRIGSGATIEFDSGYVSTSHARLYQSETEVMLVDLESRNGTAVNHTPISAPTPISNQDIIQIGPYTATVLIKMEAVQMNGKRPLSMPAPVFPPPEFNHPVVSLAALAPKHNIETTTYLSIGGGIGSFIWADHLRIFGVPASDIVSIGFEMKPYDRYRRLCKNSQIPDHERLRSNSDSCPDNIWGWPGYGVREMWGSMRGGNLTNVAKTGWKLFNEPLVETYTPKSGDVYDSMDREAERIGWAEMWRRGRVRAIRKTDDGRYIVAYTHMPQDGAKQHRLIVANYVHLAVGYPGVRFLPDLQAYREKTGDFTRVVNAYELHEHVYQTLAQQGGVILIRGRGIVASRIIQRIYELRQTTNQPIQVLHLMRVPNDMGNRYGQAQRQVNNHWEFQPFNWPKAAWGGDLRHVLADASTQTQHQLYQTWGGTTTADRVDWRDMVSEGVKDGWYKIQFGKVEDVVQLQNGRLSLTLQTNNTISSTTTLSANYIIDATGLESNVKANALLNDLITAYDLPLNGQGRFNVTSQFEIEPMRQRNGRLFASGVITLGSHYAPVDSFLGLQFAALQSVDYLSQLNAPSVRHINGMRSVAQWTRWAIGATP
ncbi:MAG: FHA domain-containing protein [Chloroflexi bacterium]|nr:FHA domain-containing protein [Chloroflexota bacterium]